MAGRAKRAVSAGGVVAAVLGLAVAVAPGLAPFTASQVVLWALGGAALVSAAIAFQGRRFATLNSADSPTPEDRRDFRRPGARIDRVIARGFGGADADAIREREQFRERIYPVAVDVVMRQENVSRERAEQLLETGEWTDDRYAARYFAGPSIEIPFSERLRRRIRGKSMRTVYATRAIDELAEGVVA